MKKSVRFLLMMFLCVSCRSIHTGVTRDYKTDTETQRLDLRDLEKTSLLDLSSIRQDSIHLRITEYYRPVTGDTATRGPVKAEIEIIRGVVTKVDSSATIIENIKELSMTEETVSIEQHEEIKTRSEPWYLSWKVILAASVILLIILVYLIRK